MECSCGRDNGERGGGGVEESEGAFTCLSSATSPLSFLFLFLFYFYFYLFHFLFTKLFIIISSPVAWVFLFTKFPFTFLYHHDHQGERKRNI
ncbi:hypothetical protein QBC42DRAFT_34847 [Cladorrhinum samala]|uniref:Uncharacterized protein n=1 Tax=Cladorrhinum samala TaxID=585594 RepID=A0AAV9HE21_9PEZI|nr:hypothetical protein QBC42DRAFT_34847 [Cladorrhinum samala]